MHLKPKARGMKFYAVRNGRQGAKVYQTWEEAKPHVSRYPGAVHKSFTNRAKAEEWITVTPALQATYLQALPQDLAPAATLSVTKETIARPPGQLPITDKLNAHQPVGVGADQPISHDKTLELSPAQQAVLDLVKQGKNVFFTGSAGTGKSILLRAIIDWCKKEHGDRPAVTATTGIASVNIGGCTIHSWGGIGLGKEDGRVLLAKLLGKHEKLLSMERDKTIQQDVWDRFDEDVDGVLSHSVDRWTDVKTLIIDEISMMNGLLFDKLEFIARKLRRSSKPFGGIQLVLSGDFCQLPPVPDRSPEGVYNDIKFAFEADTWEKCVGKPVILTQVFRQKEQNFVNMLNEMRLGRMRQSSISAFRSLSRPVRYTDDIEPTDLFPTRNEVDRANMSRLAKLPSPQHVYHATDTPGTDDHDMPISAMRMERLLETLIAPQELKLKVGAQVMLVKNLVQGSLVNGSVGRVVGFSSPKDAIRQGFEVSMAQEPEKNQDPQVEVIPRRLLSDRGIWPVVAFQNGKTILCVPVAFEMNNAAGRVMARREQVPLILAWALSIHKSQGQTLERVRVDLGRIFEKGQAYVALSRATNMNTLQVLNFDPGKVIAHPRVLAYMNKTSPSKRSFIEDEQDFNTSMDEDLNFWEEFL